MGPMILRREVLPPRSASGRYDPAPWARAAITRAIWGSVILVGLASMLARLLEAWL